MINLIDFCQYSGQYGQYSGRYGHNIVVRNQYFLELAIRRHSVARTKNARVTQRQNWPSVATPSPARRMIEERTGNTTSEFLSKSDFGAICVQIYTISDRKSARLTYLEGSLEGSLEVFRGSLEGSLEVFRGVWGILLPLGGSLDTLCVPSLEGYLSTF